MAYHRAQAASALCAEDTIKFRACGYHRAALDELPKQEIRCRSATVPHRLKLDKTNSQSGHEALSQHRETIRGTTMRAQRVWKVNGATSIGQLQSRLDDLNKRLGQLESQHPDSWKLDELRSSALSLSREIDDIRCAEATAALSELLRK
ncbi:hypothetical protein [Bradyrhizobium glycinis]|uniref:hypothetical protein n=1 Tax=Bradyrhizobium glycinis TaxID=2751812 RepID=UPI001FE41920|nr:hypothetical protein [Bradyrhizobium glycinis]